MGRITAIFDTVRAAQEARDALVREGLDADRIALGGRALWHGGTQRHVRPHPG